VTAVLSRLMLNTSLMLWELGVTEQRYQATGSTGQGPVTLEIFNGWGYRGWRPSPVLAMGHTGSPALWLAPPAIGWVGTAP
jgi:hypothetical protein